MKEERALQVKRPGCGPPYGGEHPEQPASDLPLFRDIIRRAGGFVNGTGCAADAGKSRGQNCHNWWQK